MRYVHRHWIEQERVIVRSKAGWEKDLYNWTYRELSAALKKLLGRDDDYCVLYTIVDKESLLVLFEKQWIRIYIEHILQYL
jgi:hypothetical protein